MKGAEYFAAAIAIALVLLAMGYGVIPLQIAIPLMFLLMGVVAVVKSLFMEVKVAVSGVLSERRVCFIWGGILVVLGLTGLCGALNLAPPLALVGYFILGVALVAVLALKMD